MREIIIDKQNKEQYSNGTYPKITSIVWRLRGLDKNILKNFPNLTIIRCFNTRITDLSPLQHCCTGLNELFCGNNQIIDLSPLQYCLELTKLYCPNNQITDLSPLRHCVGLTELICSNNQITDLNPLQYCTRLTILYCGNNRITDLTPLQHSCTELTELYCSDNDITNLEPIVYLRRLTQIYTGNNPLNPPSIQVVRFLDRIDQIQREFYNYSYNDSYNDSIYTNTQNVHDVKVQQSVMDSVRNLMKDKLPNNEEITLDIDSVLNSELQEHTKSRLLEYFEGAEAEPHIILLITYKELFAYVWNRIINNPNKLELLKILDENIQDSECKCFTGRFNRTLSTLVGFYDDIQINISDNSRISAIILQVKDSIIPYDVIKHKELARNTLLEGGYDSEVIDVWIEAIE